MAKAQKRGNRFLKPGAKKKRGVKIDPDTIDDPELRRWIKEIQLRQQEAIDPKRQPVVRSVLDNAGQGKALFRRKLNKPVPLSSVLKVARRKTAAPRMNEDIKLVREAWERAVGAAIASETRVYSFAKGVLTVEVMSSPLLQEIRQFHRHAIFSDLSDLWKASQPLISMKFRLGKK